MLSIFLLFFQLEEGFVKSQKMLFFSLIAIACFGYSATSFPASADTKHCVVVSGHDLTIDDVVNVARNRHTVVLSDDAKERIKRSRETVDALVDQDKVVYGLTTGFGSLATVSISKEQTKELQVNLIRSHAVGVGPAFSEDVVRAAMLLRVSAFAQGASGIRLETVHKLIEMLNKNIYPYVPQKGSVGASGDLAPLSHIMLVLMGEGEVFYEGRRVATESVLQELEFTPISLVSKEGLALNNGCTVLTGLAALTIADAQTLIKSAQITAAATFEALKACSSPFDPRIHMVRPHWGQIECAFNMRSLLQDSQLIDSKEGKIQDCYSIRCFPQIMGASIDAFRYAKKIVETEMNSATDNPLIFDDAAYSGGNFHGQPVAFAMDFLGIALAEVANVSERRSARLVDPGLNEGLPAFLVEGSGLNSGFMIPQYTAASLVSENKVLAHPSSVDSIPTCANQEDHVSMASFAARKAAEILNNAFFVVAIELHLATQALEFRTLTPGYATRLVKDIVREKVTFVEDDCVLYKDMETLTEMLKSNIFVDAVEKQIAVLSI